MVRGYGKDAVYIYAELTNQEIKQYKKEGYRKVYTHNLFNNHKVADRIKAVNKNGIGVI